jgi:membrane associated rhomboid family serine protease
MKLLDALERRWRRFGVPYVTEALIAGQVVVYLVQHNRPEILDRLTLVPRLVLEGEAWRVVSFLLQPPLSNPIFAFFFWYLFYLMGTSLESTWGALRYNVFLLIGYLATVAAAFATPDQPTGAVFLQGSVFLAFAYLYPDFQLMLFFLLPIKIKWLALLTWIGYFLTIAMGPWQARLAALAAVSNFFAFFGGGVWLRVRAGRRRMADQARQIKQSKVPRHVCRVCGRNNLTDRQTSFRYCTKCTPAQCYCQDHLGNHEHLTVEQKEPAK